MAHSYPLRISADPPYAEMNVKSLLGTLGKDTQVTRGSTELEIAKRHNSRRECRVFSPVGMAQMKCTYALRKIFEMLCSEDEKELRRVQ